MVVVVRGVVRKLLDLMVMGLTLYVDVFTVVVLVAGAFVAFVAVVGLQTTLRV